MSDTVTDALNRALAEMNIDFGFTRQASYRYYRADKPRNNSRKKDMYFYTVRRISHKGNQRFVSGIYRYNASKKSWVAGNKAGHAKKKDAIERARRLAEQNA